MKVANPLDEQHDLTPLDRCRAEALLRVLPHDLALNADWMKNLRQTTGLTSGQFDKALNVLIEADLVTVSPGAGCVVVGPTGNGQELRETLQ